MVYGLLSHPSVNLEGLTQCTWKEGTFDVREDLVSAMVTTELFFIYSWSSVLTGLLGVACSSCFASRGQVLALCGAPVGIVNVPSSLSIPTTPVTVCLCVVFFLLFIALFRLRMESDLVLVLEGSATVLSFCMYVAVVELIWWLADWRVVPAVVADLTSLFIRLVTLFPSVTCK